MHYEVIPVGAYEANCGILWNDPAQAWVVDPGSDGEIILGLLEKKGLKVGVVVLTHAHFDHISAVNEILAKFPVPVYMNAADAAYAFSPMNAMPPYQTTRRPPQLVTDKQEGDRIACGGLTATLLFAPGHTPGGWCLYFEAEKLLVAGDLLFAGSVGRTDFPGGSWQEMERSLQKIKALPDDTRVICGHGPMTTIGTEKRSNPYL